MAILGVLSINHSMLRACTLQSWMLNSFFRTLLIMCEACNRVHRMTWTQGKIWVRIFQRLIVSISVQLIADMSRLLFSHAGKASVSAIIAPHSRCNEWSWRCLYFLALLIVSISRGLHNIYILCLLIWSSLKERFGKTLYKKSGVCHESKVFLMHSLLGLIEALMATCSFYPAV